MTALYAIQHITTGQLLPVHDRRKTTAAEFGGPGVPRLFTRRADAVLGLKWWLRGRVEIGRTDKRWTKTPQPERRAEDVRIIEVQVMEVFPSWVEGSAAVWSVIV